MNLLALLRVAVMRRFLLVVIALTLAGAGCSGSSFVGRRASNLSAYYNTFYNAQKAYNEGVSVLEETEAPIDQNTYLPVFPGAERVQNTEAFDEAIEKGADVLREHPGSKWVDDALMLIGKSYFYQGNHVGAEQKFREVIERNAASAGEARFWLGRALLAGGSYEAAAQHLEESLAEGAGDWAAMLRLVLAELRVQQGAWAEAATALEQALKGSIRGEDTRARAQFLLGQVYETLGSYEEAARAYTRAAEERPRYELTYAAQIGALRALGRAGRTATALERLRQIERDDKHTAKRAELALLRAQLYQMQDRPEAAEAAYRALLYDNDDDEAPPSPEVRGRAHHALAVLYRDAYNNYVRAAAHFDTASAALEQASAVQPAAPSSVAVTDSREQAERFGRVAAAARRVERLDSLLYLSSLSDDAFNAFVEKLRRQRAQEQEALREALAEETRARRFADQPERSFDADGFGANERAATTASAAEASFLFHDDPARAQQAWVNFVQQWGRRPRVPNWRRLSAISGEARTTAPGAPAQEAGPDVPEAVSQAMDLSSVDLSEVPRTEAGRAEMRAERARARYELANALFLAAGQPDSAAVWYRRVLEEDGNQPVARRAYYALAEARSALGDTAAAERLYRQIISQESGSELAERARTRLQEEGAAPQTAAGSSVPGEAAYERAYAVWQRGAYARALTDMIGVAATYRDAEVAPRALLAAGQIALEWIKRDTLRLHDPLPVILPDSLQKPGGLLAAAGTPPDAAEARPAVAFRAPFDTLAALFPFASVLQKRGTPLRVEALFSSLVTHYPQTPHAERARLLLQALNERQPPALAQAKPRAEEPQTEEPQAEKPQTPPDTAAAQAGPPALAETAAPDTSVASDTSAAPEPAAPAEEEREALPAEEDQPLIAEAEPEAAEDDSAAAENEPEEETPLQPPAEGETPLFGSGIDRSAGGWTLVVASRPQRAAADSVAAEFRRQGYRTDLLIGRADGTIYYRVGVGQFATQEAARAALRRLADTLPADTWLLQLSERN